MNKFFTVFFIIIFSVSLANSQNTNFTSGDLQTLNGEIAKLFQLKKFGEALNMAKKAVEMSEQIHGNNSLETAKAYRNLGFVHFHTNNLVSAETNFENASVIYEKMLKLEPEDALAFAEMLESLAIIKFKNQRPDAESLFEKALSWFEKADGKNSLKPTKTLYILANISFWKKSYKKSAQYYQRLFEIVIKNPSAKELDYKLVYFRAACAYRKAEMKFNALEADFDKFTQILAENDSDKLFISGVVNGKAVYLQTPVYSAEAKQAHARGEIKVEVLISREGTIISACGKNEGHSALIEASEAAAYRSKFTPTLFNGTPVIVSGTIVYRFF